MNFTIIVCSYHGDEEEIPGWNQSHVTWVGIGEAFDVEEAQHESAGGNPSLTAIIMTKQQHNHKGQGVKGVTFDETQRSSCMVIGALSPLKLTPNKAYHVTNNN